MQYVAGVDSRLPRATLPQITVRQMEMADIPTLAALLRANADWVGSYKKGPPEVGRDVVRLLTLELAAQTRGSHWFGVILIESDVVGQVSLRPISAQDPSTEFTIWISENASGRGIGKAALRLLCELAFAQQQRNVLYGRIERTNGPSLAVAAAAGFEMVRPDGPASLSQGNDPTSIRSAGITRDEERQWLMLALTRERWSRAQLGIAHRPRTDSG